MDQQPEDRPSQDNPSPEPMTGLIWQDLWNFNPNCLVPIVVIVLAVIVAACRLIP